jgi:hypothetical protein
MIDQEDCHLWHTSCGRDSTNGPTDAIQPDMMIVRRELPDPLTAAGADKGHAD